MAIPDILFYILAVLTLIFGALVIANPFSGDRVGRAMFPVLMTVAVLPLFTLHRRALGA